MVDLSGFVRGMDDPAGLQRLIDEKLLELPGVLAQGDCSKTAAWLSEYVDLERGAERYKGIVRSRSDEVVKLLRDSGYGNDFDPSADNAGNLNVIKNILERIESGQKSMGYESLLIHKQRNKVSGGPSVV